MESANPQAAPHPFYTLLQERGLREEFRLTADKKEGKIGGDTRIACVTGLFPKPAMQCGTTFY